MTIVKVVERTSRFVEISLYFFSRKILETNKKNQLFDTFNNDYDYMTIKTL